MGEILVVVTGLSFLLLAVFRWALQTLTAMEKQISALHVKNGDLLEAKIRAQTEASRLREVNQRLKEAGRQYKERYLEQALENEDLMNRIS